MRLLRRRPIRDYFGPSDSEATRSRWPLQVLQQVARPQAWRPTEAGPWLLSDAKSRFCSLACMCAPRVAASGLLHASIVYLVLLIALCKLDMEQHCKWIVHGTASVRGKDCTRMRPKLHLPVLGHVF